MPPTSIGPYRIQRLLGEGGMGAVYEGIHETTSLRVAIKVLHPEYARDATMTGRFFNEARAVNKIEHPGIVQVFDYGQQADGCAYLAMEFLKGESLSSRLARGQRARPLGESLRLGWQVATALAAAHANGIVHRDLKPDNIMIVPDSSAPGGERTKLLDFGIAKLVEAVRGNQPKTQSQIVMGTPQYMSPEQCKSASLVDEKTDVYALGVLLFELLAGRTPFVAESGGEYIGMHLFREPPRLNSIAPNLPAELASMVDSMLLKGKTERPSMSQVVAALALYVRRYGSPSFQSEQIYSVAHRAAEPTMHLGGASTLGRSTGQLGGRALKVRWLSGGVILLALISAIAVGLRARSGARNYGTSPAGGAAADQPSPQPTPQPPTRLSKPPSRMVNWSIRTVPSGAAVLDSEGHNLGRTPWQQQLPVSSGTRTLSLQLSGYAEQTVTLDCSENADRQERLRPTPRKNSPSKRPAPPQDKTSPATIDYEL